jgi:hypothetical protein
MECLVPGLKVLAMQKAGLAEELTRLCFATWPGNVFAAG